MVKTRNTKPVPLTAEQEKERARKQDLDKIQTCINNIGDAPNNRKQFVIGESVIIIQGGFISSKVIDIIETGIYEVEIICNSNIAYSSKTEVKTIIRILGWHELFKLPTLDKDSSMLVLGEGLGLNFMQQTVDSLLNSYIIYFGTDFNPDYQRELVWDNEDEEKLLDSIFNHIDIGKFCFIQLPYKENGKTYEVLDGKQRLNTIYRFYTDQFTYKGFYYSELPFMFKYTFTNTSIAVAITKEEYMSRKSVYKYFLSLNTGGKPMNPSHLNKIKEMYNNLAE